MYMYISTHTQIHTHTLTLSLYLSLKHTHTHTHTPQGCPFTSKPEVARFKDFSPGQRLRQKITLTNVTYSVNFCKLVGVSPQLEDFVTVEFSPPGPMSAGLTCHMTVTFEPKVTLMHHTD